MKKKTGETKSATRTSKYKFKLRPSDWPLAPLAVLTAYAWHQVLTSHIVFHIDILTTWRHNIIFHPVVAMFAIAIFGSLYIYRDIRRKDVGKYSRRIAYLFAALVLYYFVVQLNAAMSSGASSTCTGLMGNKTTCAEVGQLYAYIYLLNPFSLLVGGVLSTVGSILLLIKTRRERVTSQKTRFFK